MAFLDGTIVNVALPAIGRDLDASTGELQWVLNGYMLALGALILLGGSLGDRHGRRRVFVLGTALFTAASGLCAAAPSPEALIAARALQGVGGALLTPGSLAMIEASFRREDRARAIGAWSGLAGVATALGPLAGGWFVDAISWRAAFLVNLPLGLAVLAGARHVPETRDESAAGRLDVRGALLAALALGVVTYALIDAHVGLGAAGVVLFGAFLVAQRRTHDPMLPLGMFATRQFSAANAVTFVVYAALGGSMFLLVAFLQIALGYSAIAAGSAALPITLLLLLLSARGGALAQRIGPRRPLALGSLMIGAAFLWMTRIDPGDGYPAAVLPPVVLEGLGLVLVVAPVTSTVLAAADDRHAGVASAINNAVARVGSLLAVAVLPLAAGLAGDDFYDPSAMTDGFHMAMAVCAALCAAGAAIAWLTITDP
jgi:EmrB/QacA subfamily drug resistance transporter